MAVKVNNFIILDFETGGLSPEDAPVMEVALIAIDGISLNEVTRYQTLVKGYDNLPYNPGALKANGIAVEECMKKGLTIEKTVSELIDQFLLANTLNSKTHKPIFVGHNVKFDLKFLEWIFKREKQDVWKYIDETVIDTLQLAKMTYGIDIENHKLGTVCQKAGIDLFDAHRAMGDVEATVELFKMCVNRMRSVGSTATNISESHEKPKFQF